MGRSRHRSKQSTGAQWELSTPFFYAPSDAPFPSDFFTSLFHDSP